MALWFLPSFFASICRSIFDRCLHPRSVTKHPKRISVIDHRANGAVFAGINLHLNGLRLRFWFKMSSYGSTSQSVLLQSLHLNLRLLISRPWPKHVAARLSAVNARSLVAFPAAGSHHHTMASRLP